MKKLLLILMLTIYFVFFTQRIEAQNELWDRIFVFPENYRIYTLSFSDSLNGWAGGETIGPVGGVILNTKDGGQTWSEQFVYPEYSWFNNIDFVDSLNGWAAGLHCLFKTSNGGKEWIRVADSLFDFDIYMGLSDLQSVSFADTAFGIITGTESTIAITLDGGNTWNCATINPENVFIDTVYYGVVLSAGKACVTGRGGVAVSVDSGKTWHITHNEDRSYIKCSFIENGYGWVLSRDGQIQKTRDYGESWIFCKQIFEDGVDYAVDISFLDSLTGWVIANNGEIWETNDGGYNWLSSTISQDTALAVITSATNNATFVLNKANSLYKYKRFSAITEFFKKLPDCYKLCHNYPNPFNSSTNIKYSIPSKSPVKIQVIDVNGNLLETLVDRSHEPGNYQITWDASGFSSGIYFYRIQAGDFIEARKCLLIK
ncbi:MAG: T9SS type A sorting domain-containing protein [Candidatus Marinimicrobia bacterium]|nr:T9SS type A sorting domain-containing protein [Candidatus Neomarinimicrobiota bacterium]